MADRMNRTIKNLVTNADVVNGHLLIGRYDGSVLDAGIFPDEEPGGSFDLFEDLVAALPETFERDYVFLIGTTVTGAGDDHYFGIYEDVLYPNDMYQSLDIWSQTADRGPAQFLVEVFSGSDNFQECGVYTYMEASGLLDTNFAGIFVDAGQAYLGIFADSADTYSDQILEVYGADYGINFRGDGNLWFEGDGTGIVLQSPNGSVKKKLTIDNSGNPVWTTV